MYDLRMEFCFFLNEESGFERWDGIVRGELLEESEGADKVRQSMRSRKSVDLLTS